MNGTLPQPAPAVLGHEGAGEIIEVGEGVDQVAVGDHVIVAWTPPCGKCTACLRGEANLCVEIFFNIAGSAKFSRGGQPIFGFAGTGTFAEEMVLPQQGVVKIPDDVPYEIGALIGCGVTTGVGAALNTAKVQPGSSVVVFGAGGVGIAAIQGARIAGAAEIVAVDMVDSKLEGRPALRGDPRGEARRARRRQRRDQRRRGLRLRLRVHRPAPDHPGRLRRGAPRRHGGDRGRGQRRAHVEFNCFELFFMEKKLLGSLLRLGRRAHRVRPPHPAVEGGPPRPRGHDLRRAWTSPRPRTPSTP